MDFGMPNMNISELIELISNEDMMFQYQGVMQLREILSMSNEQSLGSFPLDRACKRLIDLLGQPVVSEFSHEIKYFAMSCLHSLMDIYPSHIPTLIGQNLIENLSEAMEAAAAFGLEDMNQICIKAIEQISQENPRAILNHGKSLNLCINIIDFLEVGFQKRVLKILLNVAHHSASEEQFNSSLVPTLPVLCQMLSLNCEDDIAKAERVSVILKRMTDSFTRFQSPVEKFDRVGAMFECFSQIGIIEIMIKGLQDFTAHEAAQSKKLLKVKKDEQNLAEDQLMMQNINTQPLIKRAYNQVTISNFLKILTFSCKYTQQIVMQLISGGILEILENLIPFEDSERANYIQDVLGLLESLFPCPETKDGTIAFSGSLLMLGHDQILNSDAINADPRMDKFKQAVKNLENEKRSFFVGFDETLKKSFMTKLLPKIFSIYKSNMQTNVRTRCLNLIDKILHIVPSDLIKSQIDPVQFAQFLQMIFLSGNGQQVLLSLRMIERVQETDQLRFAVQFIRQGISHFVSQLQDPKNVKQYDEVEPKLADPFMQNNNYLPKQFQNEKEILLQRIKEIQHILAISGEDLTPDQKNDLDQILTERMNALISLKTKERMIAEVQAIKRTEDQKLKEAERTEIKEEQTENIPQKTSELIMKEAKNIVTLYFENGELISKIKAEYPQEIQALQDQKKLAQALLEESIQEQFDIEKTQKLMQDLAAIITSPLGISNFEFTESGLLKALQQFLTVAPSQSLLDIQSQEEVKNSEKQQKKTQNQVKKNISKKDSKTLILRLKVFAHVMCHENNQLTANQPSRLPFLDLISQCHAVISVNEPILFNKDNKNINGQSTVEALKQLNKHVVINLVYDPDRKQIEQGIRALKQSKTLKPQQDQLSLALANNDEIIASEDEDQEKMESDIMKSPVPHIDRKIKSVALPFGHLSAADAKIEKSKIFNRRHKLFTELSQVPLNIQQRDNIWLLEDFLLKRIKTIDDVKKLVLHTRPAYSSGLFNQLPEFQFSKQFDAPIEEIEKYQLQELHSRCLERIEYVISNAQDSEEFHLMLPDNIKELTHQIVEQTQKNNFSDKELDLLFKHLVRDTEEMIKEHELGQASGDEDQEMIDRDANEIAYYIQIKVLDFIKMIEKLRETVSQKLNRSKNLEDENMEESKEHQINFENISKEQLDEWDSSDMEKKIVTKIESASLKPHKGDEINSIHSVSEQSLESPAMKQESSNSAQLQEQVQVKSKEPDASLSKSQQSDIEMTDEQNLNSVSQLSEDKNNEALDEAMKDDGINFVETKIDELLHVLPGKITKSSMDEKMKQINQTQKLMQQQIQKFKQQHILQQIAPEKAFSLSHTNKSQDEDFMKMDIEELIQLNQGEDIEIEFYCNGKKLELNTSLYEIIKDREDPNLKSEIKKPVSKQPKNPTDHIREVLQNLHSSQSINLSNYHTIYFSIKDKKNQHIVQDRKDSLADLAFRIQRSKSLVQDDISLSSVNLVVQQLIEREFQVFSKDSNHKHEPQEEADTERDKNMQNLEYALKILKVLYFIHKSAQLFTEQGINFLLVKSSTDQLMKKLAFDDIELQNVAKQQIKSAAFRHSKLDDNMVKQIQNPYKLVQGGLSEILKNIFQSCSFLFDFETKLLYFKLVSFISIDINRSLYFLQNYLTQKGLLGKSSDEQSNGALSFFNQGRERDEGTQNKVKKQPFKIERSKILEEAFNISSKLQKRCLLEIEYNNEAGTGLGPTLEFFTLFADEIKKVEDGSMWIKTGQDEYLFPKALVVTPSNLEKTRRICSLFQLTGTFIAKSIVDDRLIDLPLSPLMWDLILGKKMNLFDLRRLDVHYFNTFSLLQILANRKKEVDEMVGLDQEARKRLLGSIKTPNGASVENFDLYFVCPTENSIELIKDGSEEKVTLDNLQDYIDLSLHYIFHETISMQLKSFKKGFSQILPIESLRPFRSEAEIETLICGQLSSEEWTNFDHLMEVIVPDHGFDHKSRVFRDFIRFLTELKPSDRPQLMKFFTGSRRLHSGGFAALNPHLTVVLKKIEGIPDMHLPSVSTCAKYLKIPEYTSYEILKLKFNQAMWEGADNFTLS